MLLLVGQFLVCAKLWKIVVCDSSCLFELQLQFWISTHFTETITYFELTSIFEVYFFSFMLKINYFRYKEL